MNLYAAAVTQPKKMLVNLDNWLAAGIAHAEKKSFDPNVLMAARLAPDQYTLLRQVQAACDSAKFPAARLAGKQPPAHPDTEQTMVEARARIATCIAYLETFSESDFAGAETRRIALPFLEGKAMPGSTYWNEMALPNFYFHVVTAYSILRHNGVELGKVAFIGGISLEDL